MAPNSKSNSLPNGPPLHWTIANHQKMMNGPMLVANGPADSDEEKGKIGGNEPKLDDQHNLDALISDPICQRLFRSLNSPRHKSLHTVTHSLTRKQKNQFGKMKTINTSTKWPKLIFLKTKIICRKK